MDLMRGFPDKYFDLAIVDPPYGIGAAAMNLGKWGGSRLEKKDWDAAIPTPEYFAELRRVSRHQIVWGGNYYPMPCTRCWVIWDKGAGFKGRDFSEAEMAWASFDAVTRVFTYDPLAGGDYIGRIHKTQKPVALYRWLLDNYAKPGQRILDTHLGSGSIAIACHYAGHPLTACEIDRDYYEAALQRIKRETAQMTLLDTPNPGADRCPFATARARLERELSQGLLDFSGGAVAPTHNTMVHRTDSPQPTAPQQ